MASVLTLLSGNSSKDLAEDVAKILDGASLAPATVSKFANGETSVSIGCVSDAGSVTLDCVCLSSAPTARFALHCPLAGRHA